MMRLARMVRVLVHFQSFDADKLLGFGKINGALVKTAAENSSHNAGFFHLQERAHIVERMHTARSDHGD